LHLSLLASYFNGNELFQPGSASLLIMIVPESKKEKFQDLHLELNFFFIHCLFLDSPALMLITTVVASLVKQLLDG
jgi:hypothetical protein